MKIWYFISKVFFRFDLFGKNIHKFLLYVEYLIHTILLFKKQKNIFNLYSIFNVQQNTNETENKW